VTARAKGEEAPKLLFTIATQLPWQLKLPACLKIKEVALRVVLKIDQMQGKRLASFKRTGHLRSDGRLDLSGVCYTPYFNEQGKLVKVKHQSGAEANAEKLDPDGQPLRLGRRDADEADAEGPLAHPLRRVPDRPLHRAAVDEQERRPAVRRFVRGGLQGLRGRESEALGWG